MHLNKLRGCDTERYKIFQLRQDFDLLVPALEINQFLKVCKQPYFHKYIFLKIPPKDGISG